MIRQLSKRRKLSTKKSKTYDKIYYWRELSNKINAKKLKALQEKFDRYVNG